MTAVIAQPFSRSTGPKSATGISGPGLITGTVRAADWRFGCGGGHASDRRLCGMSSGRLLLGGHPAGAARRRVGAAGQRPGQRRRGRRRGHPAGPDAGAGAGRPDRGQGRQPVRPERGDAGAGAGRRDQGRRDGAGGQRRGHAADQRPRLSGWCRPAWRPGCGELPARPVGGDDGAGGVRAARRAVLFRGVRAAQASARKTWLRGLAAEARTACSSSRRGGWRPACRTPSRCWARSAGPWCAAS